MPPKPVTKVAAKGGAKAGPSKPAAKTATKAGGAAAKSDTAKKTDVKKAEADMAKMSIKAPDEIVLKELAGVMALSSEVGQKAKDSGKWLFLIDRTGQAHTFLKYRDVNMISVASQGLEFNKEPLRKALMGSLCFGKPNVIDVSDIDPSKAIDTIRDKYNEIYAGLWNDIMDRSILEEDKFKTLYQPGQDPDDYKNEYNYRVSDFQFIVITNTDPPTTAIDFYPVIIN